MIEFATGNLLTAPAEALVNTVNTVGVMGKGIALQFRQAFPDNYKAYRVACAEGRVSLGRMFVFDAGKLTTPHYVINFPTKGHWKANSRIEDIDAGLDDLVRVLRELGIASVAVPPLGCGNGGLDWDVVRPRITERLGPLPCRVLVYAPVGAPPAAAMPVRTPRPALTPGRAALLGLVGAYTVPAAGASLIEVQKLMYFLQEAGEALHLRFEPAHYGPYAERLNQVLVMLEGHYLQGYGDRSNSYADIRILPQARDDVEKCLDLHPATGARVRRVLRLVEGLESAYGVELLATVHWIATRDRRAVEDLDVLVTQVHAWSRRKRELFERRHIELSWLRLREEGWLHPVKGPEAPAREPVG